MNPRTIHRFFKKLETDQFSLVYLGEFDDELTTTLMRLNETSINEPHTFTKTLSSLIVECFQNIIRHADKPDLVTRTNNKPRMFLIRNSGNKFYIASTNLINNEKKEGLTSKLKAINTLTEQELKLEYMNALASTGFNDQKGAGLGFIEMARKSNYLLDFDFEFVNYFFSVFYLQLHVQSTNVSTEKSIPPIKVEDTKELYNAMLQDNVVMVRKGDFSQKSILPVLQLIENNISLQQKMPKLSKMALYLLVEMLQNISKHASEINNIKEGIFIIAVQNNTYTLNTGNFIDVNKVDALKERLKNLISLDETALGELYKATLLKKENIAGAGAGMGLIEICKYSSDKIKYNFTPVNDQQSFFSLNITV